VYHHIDNSTCIVHYRLQDRLHLHRQSINQLIKMSLVTHRKTHTFSSLSDWQYLCEDIYKGIWTSREVSQCYYIVQMDTINDRLSSWPYHRAILCSVTLAFVLKETLSQQRFPVIDFLERYINTSYRIDHVTIVHTCWVSTITINIFVIIVIVNIDNK